MIDFDALYNESKTELRKIPCHAIELCYAEFVRNRVIFANPVIFSKAELAELCKERNIEVKPSTLKDRLYDALIESGVRPIEFERKKAAAREANHREFSGISVSSFDYQKTFGLSHRQVKALEKKGFLHVVGAYRVRAYGKDLFVPLYSAWQFATVTEEEIKEALERR